MLKHLKNVFTCGTQRTQVASIAPMTEEKFLQSRASACESLVGWSDRTVTASFAARYIESVKLYSGFIARLDRAIANSEDMTGLFASLEAVCANVIKYDSYLFPFFDTK